jgi:hypothetical protein
MKILTSTARPGDVIRTRPEGSEYTVVSNETSHGEHGYAGYLVVLSARTGRAAQIAYTDTQTVLRES